MAQRPPIRVHDWSLPLWQMTGDETARYFAVWGGRGSSKSWGIAQALVARSIRETQRILCAREVQRSIKDSVKKLLEDTIDRMGKRHMFDITRDEIRCTRSGSVFIFAGLRDNVDTIRSMEGVNTCWVSEAHRISRNSLQVLIPTIRAPKSQVIFDWNPREATDPIDEMFRCADPPPGSIVVNVNYPDNPDFPEVLRAEMEYDRQRDPDKYQHIWLGGYLSRSDERVFHNWKIEEFEHRTDVTRRQGADWGFAVDPTTLVNCYVEGRTLYVEYEAYMVGCEIVDTPDLFGTVPESDRWPIIADSARPETINYMKQHGFPKIFPSVKGAGSVEEGVEWLKSHDIVVHPRCTHTIDELSTYAYKVDTHTQRVLPKLKDAKNHIIDALRYALEGLRRANGNGNGGGRSRPSPKPIPTASRW